MPAGGRAVVARQSVLPHHEHAARDKLTSATLPRTKLLADDFTSAAPNPPSPPIVFESPAIATEQALAMLLPLHLRETVCASRRIFFIVGPG